MNIALLGFALHIIFSILSSYLGIWSGTQSPVFLSLLLFGSGLIWGVLFIHMRQRSLVTVEKENIKVLKEKAPGSSHLFEDEAYDSFSAKARLKQMEQWFLPAVSLLIAFYMLAMLVLRFAGIMPVPEIAQIGRTAVAAVGIAAIAFVLFIFGRYAGGLATAPQWRLIQAGGAISILCAICSIAVSAGVVMIYLGLPKVEKFISFAIPLVMGALGIELVLNFILHLYRPKVEALAYLPPYSSRMLSMLARPSGALRTVAEALDYQFGVKISQTWFYIFLERAIAPIILFQIIAFYALTCIVVVNPEEKAIVERFGVPAEHILAPGLHFKLPWPVEKVFKHSTKRVMRMTIGAHAEDEDHEEHGRRGKQSDVILWTVEHGCAANKLIVASSETVSGEREDLVSVPVNLLNASVDIQYRINDLRTFLYKKQDPLEVLDSIASRELIRFMVSVDLFDIMGSGRLKASEHLAARIRDACKRAELGLEVLYVGFENVHPPVEVAGAFEDVVGAIEEKHASVLAAESYRNRILPLAEYQEMVLKIEASAYKFRREKVASARADQFRKQYEADKSCTRVYRVRKFLDLLEENLKDLRKYVVPEEAKAHQVTIVDMKEKLRPELLDIDLTEMEGE